VSEQQAHNQRSRDWLAFADRISDLDADDAEEQVRQACQTMILAAGMLSQVTLCL
jgi:hypothetical protein